MRQFFLLIVIALSTSHFSALAGTMQGGIKPGKIHSSKDKKFIITPSVTYEKANFDFSIGYPHETVNVVSFLDLKELNIYKGNIQVKAHFGDYMVKGEFSYGRIMKGSFHDYDYSGANKTLIWSYSRSKIKGSLYEINLGFGRPITLGKMFNLTPQTGFLYHHTQYNMSDLLQVASSQTNYNIYPNKGGGPIAQGTKISGKVSEYSTHIYGPWIGTDFSLEVSKFHLFGTLSAAYIFYTGKGNWILKNLKFTDTAHGWRVAGQLGAAYHFTDTFNMNMTVGGSYYKTGRGNSTYNGVTNSNYFIGAKRKAWNASLGGQLRF